MNNFEGINTPANDNEPSPEATNDKSIESSLEQKKQEAEEAVLEALSEKLNASVEQSFRKGNRIYKNICEADCVVGRAQHAVSVTQEILDQVRAEGDYHKEKAVAQLLEVLEARETFSKGIAGLSPYFAEKLGERFSDFRAILKQAENDNAINEANKENVANDHTINEDNKQEAA